MDPQRQRHAGHGTTALRRRPAATAPATPARELTPDRFEPPPLEAPLTDIARARVAREARSELEQVLAEAAQEGRAAGFEEGFLAGQAQVTAAVAEHQQATAQLRQAVSALANASATLAGHDAATLADLEAVTLEMAVGIAEALVERELANVDEPLLDACRRAARFVPSRGDVVVRVHPQTAARVTENPNDPSDPDLADRIAQALDAHHRITFVADHSVEPNGCIVHVGALRIDPQIGPALARIRTELGLDSAHDRCREAGSGAPVHPADPPRTHHDLLARTGEPGPSKR